MKVAVYTIALNEAAHVERWADSAADADYRVVADTGSTDDTVRRLLEKGVTVHRIAVQPWRFDVARNAALALLPADVDVCLTMDMDRFLAPGWRTHLEAAWTAGMTALFCPVVYRAHVGDVTPLHGWPAKNFHHRWGYRFTRPVHEALVYTGPKEVTGSCDDIIIHEVQDTDKPTRRQYLPLMEQAHEEAPDDAQICFWLGREYMWADRCEPAIDLLQRYLRLPSSRWNDERSEAMRYLARLQPEQKTQWLDKARLEAPHRREIWLDLAEEFHARSDWLNLFWACTNGIEKTHRTGSYLDDRQCWGFRLPDLAAIAAWHLDMMDRAVAWGQQALALDPGNQRLKNNLDYFIRRRGEEASRPAFPSWEGTPKGTVVRNVINGQEISFLVTNPDDAIMTCHSAGAFYEAEELELIMRHFTGKGVFVDVGANTGNHSIYISRFSDCARIIPFEPNPAAISVLKQNLRLNSCDNVETRFLGLALAGTKRRLSQSTPDANNLGHTYYFDDASGAVQAVVGDALIRDEAIEFIKIDVEGMEIDVLSGLEHTIRLWQPTMFVEVWDGNLADFSAWCERAAYGVVETFRRYEGIQNFLIKPIAAIF